LIVAKCDNILNHLLKPITTCQRSSAWLEHLTCNQKVEGPNPFVGFENYLKSLGLLINRGSQYQSKMKDKHLWFLVFTIGFFGFMIIISFVGKDSFDKILLNMYGWTILVTTVTAVYYGMLFLRNRHGREMGKVEESIESKKILKISIIVLIGLFAIPIIINFIFGLRSSFYFNQV
jgi:hypothetical protein